MAPDPPPFRPYNLMIITLVILVIDWLVLSANDLPYLPLHCFYLLFLILILGFRTQPSTYSFSTQEIQQLQNQNPSKQPSEILECVVCRKVKPPRFYHCRHCSRCICRLDHHCFFMGNCVGQYNYKVYVHLLVNGFLHTTAVSCLMVWNWREMVGMQSRMALFWLMVLPGLFGMYETSRLLSAFRATVTRNETLIESFKRVRGPRRTTLECFEQYFGKKGLSWLLPTFVPPGSCNLLQPTFPQERNHEVKEYTYADEYLYGADEEDDELDLKED